MKLLHTSDWHLGRATYQESRAPDHDAVIAEIIDIARERKPDVILHTGDLFDQYLPGYVEIERAAAALQQLAAIAPTVVVRGNHDSAALFRIFNRLLGANGRLRFVDKPRHGDDGGVLRFPVADDQVLRLAVLPFVHVSEVVDAFGPPETWGTAYNGRIRGYEAALADNLMQDFDPHRDIAMFAAHLHVGGAQLCSSERSLHVDETYATDLDALPPVSYAAFGHIHQPQRLPNTAITGRYAGSPLQLDFGEVNDRKGIVMVTVKAGEPAQVEKVLLHRGRRLRKFEGTLDELRMQAADFTDEICLITIHSPAPIPTLKEQVYDLLPDATILPITNLADNQRNDTELARPDTVAPETDLVQEFRQYLAEQGGVQNGAVADVIRVFAALRQGIDEERDTVFAEETALAQTLAPTAAGSATCDH
ncbi:metallophosphoesterase family protein [Micromonospora okii]|uniref:metallophosphoesterase family protein n=1 Tax=Micromonospora okii TaxID=1182970 RepID=UPI001E5019E9|nr:exonuclease SbcCD subunit D [Micromonospora okii]